MSQNITTDFVGPSRKIDFSDNHVAQLLFGEQFSHLRLIEDQIPVKIHARGNALSISGEDNDVEVVAALLKQLYELAHEGLPVDPADITHSLRVLRQNQKTQLRDYFLDTVITTARKKAVVPRTPNQKGYIDAMRKFDIVFGVGPAGTGKTYLAMAMAVAALQRREISRIILTRPAVEAGEKLGFLPGDLAEKVNPYLRPLYDALHDMIDFDRAGKLIEKGVVEVAPLAFMRGRTLNDAFVILDEAQNTTPEQMKMFLTRLGIGSRAVITGDITQIDLPTGRSSGLIEALEILADVPRLKVVRFSNHDVVRHPLVQAVVEAYDRSDRRREAERQDRSRSLEGGRRSPRRARWGEPTTPTRAELAPAEHRLEVSSDPPRPGAAGPDVDRARAET